MKKFVCTFLGTIEVYGEDEEDAYDTAGRTLNATVEDWMDDHSDFCNFHLTDITECEEEEDE